MATDSSPPTTRVLDVLELVAGQSDSRLRAADVARELQLSKATSHAIIHALTDRGWLVRTGPDREITLGPGLASVASAFADQRMVTRLAVRAALGLSKATGWTSSVVELADLTMFVSTIDPGDSTVIQGQRIAYAAPFGTLFAAWGTPAERVAWFRRGGLTEAAVASYGAHLDQARADGVLIERMSPVVQHVASLVQAAEDRVFPTAVRRLAGDLLEEIVRTGIGDREPLGVEHPVTSIAAPIMFPDGAVAAALVVHPLRDLSARETRRQGNMVRQAASSVSAALATQSPVSGLASPTSTVQRPTTT